MAIDWSEEISVGARVKKSKLSEIKGEIDRIADEVDEDLSWDHFSDQDDEPADDRIKNEQPQELRDKTDQIYTNRHSTVHSDNDSSVKNTDNEGYDSSDKDSADGDHNSTVYDPHYESDDSTNKGSVDDVNYESYT